MPREGGNLKGGSVLEACGSVSAEMDGPPSWQQMDHDARRLTLVEAATDIFLQYGFKKTTLDDIASAAHLQKSSLYHYFNGKDDLFLAVVNHLHSGLFERVGDALDSEPDVFAGLERAITILRDKTSTWKPGVMLLYSEMPVIAPIVRSYADDYTTTMNALFVRRIERAVNEGQLRPLPAEELVTILSLFLARAFSTPEITHDHEMAARDPMRYVRVLFAPYVTNPA